MDANLSQLLIKIQVKSVRLKIRVDIGIVLKGTAPLHKKCKNCFLIQGFVPQ